jgi:hypothetical protein
MWKEFHNPAIRPCNSAGDFDVVPDQFKGRKEADGWKYKLEES